MFLYLTVMIAAFFASDLANPSKQNPSSSPRDLNTTAVQSSHVEANESSFYILGIKLSLQYAIKLKAHPTNPAYDCVFNPLHVDKHNKRLCKTLVWSSCTGPYCGN